MLQGRPQPLTSISLLLNWFGYTFTGTEDPCPSKGPPLDTNVPLPSRSILLRNVCVVLSSVCVS